MNYNSKAIKREKNVRTTKPNVYVNKSRSETRSTIRSVRRSKDRDNKKTRMDVYISMPFVEQCGGGTVEPPQYTQAVVSPQNIAAVKAFFARKKVKKPKSFKVLKFTESYSATSSSSTIVTHSNFEPQMFSMPSLSVKIEESSRDYIAQLFEKLQELIESIPERIRHAIDGAAINVNHILPNFSSMFGLDKFLTWTQLKMEQISEFLKTPLGSFLMGLFVVICVNAFVKQCFPDIQNAALVKTIISTAILVVYNTSPAICKAISKVFNCVFDLFQHCDDFEAQALCSFEDMRDIIACLAEVVNESLKGEVFVKLFNDFLVFSSGFEKKFRGVSFTLKFLFEGTSMFIRWVSDKMGFDDLRTFGCKFPEITELALELRDITQGLHKGELRWDSVTSDKLVTIECRLRTILHTDVGHARDNASYRAEAMALLSELRALNTKCARFGGATGGPRIEPTSMVLLGAPGLGKSICSEYICSLTIPRLLCERRLQEYKKNRDNEVFTPTAGSDYMERYNGQFAIRFDDVLQMRDSPGSPNAWVLNMINMYNTAPYYPDFASLDLKGTIPFTSKVVFASDNNLQLSNQTISSIGSVPAFARRWDFTYLVTPAFRFAKREDDSREKFETIPYQLREFAAGVNPAVLVNEGHDKDEIWDFVPWNWLKGKPMGTPCKKFSEVVEYFVARHQEKHAIGTNVLTRLAADVDEAIRAREIELEAQAFGDPITGLPRGFDPWQMMGIPKDSPHYRSVSEVPNLKELFSRIVLSAHPDKNGSADNDVSAICVARNILQSAKKRKLWREILMFEDMEDPFIARKLVENKFNNEVLEMSRSIKVPLDELVRAKSYKEVVEYFTSACDHAYDDQYGSYEWLWYVSDRLGLDLSVVRAVCATYCLDEHTPFGDWWYFTKRYYVEGLKNAYQSSVDTTVSILGSLRRKIFNLKYLAIASVLFAGGYVIYKQYTGLTEEPLVEESGRFTRKRETMKGRSNKVKKIGLTSQSLAYGYDSAPAAKAAARNLVSWKLVPDDTSPVHGHFLFYKDNQAIGLHHYFDKFDADGIDVIYIRKTHSADTWKPIVVDTIDVISIDGDCNEDVVFCRFNSIKSAFKDIVKWFRCPERSMAESEELLRGVRPASFLGKSHFGALLGVSESGVFTMVAEGVFTNSEVLGTYSASKYSYGRALVYSIATRSGDCGLPWISLDNRFKDAFIGAIHSAGNGTKGLAMCVDPSSLKKAIEHFTDSGSVDTGADFVPSSMKEESFSAQIYESKGLPPQWEIIKEIDYVNVNSSSKLVKTRLYGSWAENTKFPALMHSKRVGTELIDPWYNSRLPYGVNNSVANQKLIDFVAGKYAHFLLSTFDTKHPWEPTVFTKEVAVRGVPGHFNGIPRNTSAGYPWSKYSKKKHSFFGTDSDYSFDSAECKVLFSTVEEQLRSLKQGNTPEWLYNQFLKDELRSKEKVKDGKTRLISGSPLDKSIITSMYFKDFIRWMQDNRIMNGLALGINPFKEWSILQAHLLSSGNNMIDGDFKGYDTSMLYQFDLGFLRVVESFYQTSSSYDILDTKVRQLILYDTAHSKHVLTVGNKTYVGRISNCVPSGDVLTSVKNSVNNVLMCWYVCACLYMRHQGFDPDGFDNNFEFPEHFFPSLKFTCLGDDHILSVPDSLKYVINQRTYGGEMANIGMKYTNASKGLELLDGHRPLSDVVFLKRTFTTIDEFPEHICFAPLDLNVILEMAFWVERGCPLGTLEDVVRTLLIELSAHGYDVWRRHIWPIQSSCQQNKVFCELLPILEEDVRLRWLECVHKFMDREDYYE